MKSESVTTGSSQEGNETVAEHKQWSPGPAACFFAVVSTTILFANKNVLTTWKFPSFAFLAALQDGLTLCFLHLLRAFRVISFPLPSVALMRASMPVPLFYALNVLTSLAGTQHLSLPMFVALRRFGIPMTMMAEWWAVGVVPSRVMIICVCGMVAGSIVAAMGDLDFTVVGYLFVFANNIATTAATVTISHKFATKSASLWTLLYSNTVVSLPLMITLWAFTPGAAGMDGTAAYASWREGGFLISLGVAAMLGFAINYASFVCQQATSALTTAVVGCMKNVVATYVGMLVGGYHFSPLNFLGVTLSMAASVAYAVCAFRSRATSLPHDHPSHGPPKVLLASDDRPCLRKDASRRGGGPSIPTRNPSLSTTVVTRCAADAGGSVPVPMGARRVSPPRGSAPAPDAEAEGAYPLLAHSVFGSSVSASLVSRDAGEDDDDACSASSRESLATPTAKSVCADARMRAMSASRFLESMDCGGGHDETYLASIAFVQRSSATRTSGRGMWPSQRPK
eukprot:TRINITY_DN9567_c0_g1_i1.p1 TRINITY_DN9567_c0_g1~~TRINITY_DN9567_c0_g1_i1.p1  ORF type:complete len:511 (-),score=81.74 TRINITY_DN9567_c0_g1_i1:318-1850(-)